MSLQQREIMTGLYHCTSGSDGVWVIDGVQYMHSYRVGSGLLDGVDGAIVLCLRDIDMQEKNVMNESSNTPNEVVDYPVGYADVDGMPPAAQLFYAGDVAGALALLTPYAAEMIQQDVADGLTVDDIINLRAALLSPQYLGPDYMSMRANPRLTIGTITVTADDGAETTVEDLTEMTV